MSDARWCDPGKHAFPATDPLAQSFTINKHVKNQWGGYQPQSITQEACGACAIDLGLAGLGKPDVGNREEEARDIRARAGGLRLATPKAIEEEKAKELFNSPA